MMTSAKRCFEESGGEEKEGRRERERLKRKGGKGEKEGDGNRKKEWIDFG